MITRYDFCNFSSKMTDVSMHVLWVELTGQLRSITSHYDNSQLFHSTSNKQAIPKSALFHRKRKLQHKLIILLLQFSQCGLTLFDYVLRCTVYRSLFFVYRYSLVVAKKQYWRYAKENKVRKRCEFEFCPSFPYPYRI